LPTAAAKGRPRQYCRQSCRQRHYESRHRAAELGLGEDELVLARAELDALRDRLYVLECAIGDVERDLAAGLEATELREALAWLLDAARPLVDA
jgi:putative heme degradation protein